MGNWPSSISLVLLQSQHYVVIHQPRPLHPLNLYVGQVQGPFCYASLKQRAFCTRVTRLEYQRTCFSIAVTAVKTGFHLWGDDIPANRHCKCNPGQLILRENHSILVNCTLANWQLSNNGALLAIHVHSPGNDVLWKPNGKMKPLVPCVNGILILSSHGTIWYGRSLD